VYERNFGVLAEELTRDGRLLLPIVVSELVSEDFKTTAIEWGELFNEISGAEFQIQTHDGSRGIVLGKASDFKQPPFAQTFEGGAFQREDDLLRSDAGGLYLLGSSVASIGLSSFFSRLAWEVVPSDSNV
jgi:hypothetical protein